MALTASQLRANVYVLLDKVLETGKPLLIERKGKRLRIVPEERVSKLSRLVERSDFIVGDPGNLVHMDWSKEWNPDSI